MKNLKILLSTLLMLAFAITINAQLTVGARGGVTLATLNEDLFSESVMDNQEMCYMVGVDFAVFSNIEVADFFSVQPELHFVQKGVKYTGEVAADNMDIKMVYRYNYLELPVLARFNMNPTETVGFNFFVGPSAGYGLNGKFKGENISIDATEAGIQKGDFETDLEWDDEYGADGTKSNRWDFGGTAGVGLEFMMDAVNIVLDARYSMDFTDAVKYETTPSPEPDKIYNRGFSFTVGVAVPIGE